MMHSVATVLRRSTANQRRRLAIALAGAAIAAGLILSLMALLVIRGSRESYENGARAAAVDVATIAQSTVASELSRFDAVMHSTVNLIALLRSTGKDSDDAVNRVLESQRQLLTGVEGLRLTDAQGVVRWGNDLPETPRIDVSDRDYFAKARAQATGAILAGPLQSRVSGHWVVALVRPVTFGERFDGILYASIPAEHFRRLFSGYEVGEQDAITLRTSALQLVARYAPNARGPADIGSKAVTQQFAAAFARDPASGVFVARAAIDGIERTNAYRRVEGWPLVLAAGFGNEQFFAPWRKQSLQVAELVFGAWLLIAGALWALYRIWMRDAQTTNALHVQTLRTQALLRVAADGIHIVDGQGRLIMMSDSFASMLGSTPERMLGRHISSWDANQDKARIDAWLAKVNVGDQQRVEVQHRREDGSIFDVELQMSVARIDGELAVFASARDITERKRILADLEASARRIRDLYDLAPCGYHSLDTAGVFVHVNATMANWLGRKPEDLVGSAQLIDFLDERSRAIFRASFSLLKTTGKLEGVELALLALPGEPSRHVRASVTAVTDADGSFLMSRSVTQDITAQVAARDEVDRLLREQTAMLDNEIVGMVKLRGRRALWKNRALDQIFGYAPEELEGASSRLLYADDESCEKVGREAYPILAQGQHFRTQLQMRRKNGQLIWIDLSGVSLSEDLTFWTMVDITAMKQAQMQIEHIAFHDALTGLPNRLLLGDRLRQAALAADRSATIVAVCYLDLDGFKQINDSHGHDVGDALLVEISRRLQATLRNNDTAGRIGGDEFVIVLTLLPDEAEVHAILQRLVASVESPVVLTNGLVVRVGASVGVSLSPRDGSEPTALLTKADQAMLRAKRAGKSRIEMA
jgi:diguanylate cyclase (GGDEF)-like protein/PAS domain S-box-containing protein